MSKHHVICTHPRAGANINGVRFEKHEKGMRTAEPVEAEVATQFRGCADFEVVEVDETPPADRRKRAGRKDTSNNDAPAAPAATDPEVAAEPQPGSDDGENETQPELV